MYVYVCVVLVESETREKETANEREETIVEKEKTKKKHKSQENEVDMEKKYDSASAKKQEPVKSAKKVNNELSVSNSSNSTRILLDDIEMVDMNMGNTSSSTFQAADSTALYTAEQILNEFKQQDHIQKLMDEKVY